MSGAPPAEVVDLYRTNPFRVLGVPVDADTRAVRRRRDQLKLAIELGTPAPAAPGPLPLDPAPDEQAVDLAYAAWQDLDRRLAAQLFWFWSPSLEGGAVDDVASRHDLAVAAHCAALDLEAKAAAGHALSAAEQKQRDKQWGVAASTWGELAVDHRVWDHLRQRVADLGDPRLTNRQVADLRMALPDQWLSINARLALDAVDTGDAAVAGHRRLMAMFVRKAGLDLDEISRALRGGAAPFVEEVEKGCDELFVAIRGRPAQACSVGTAAAARLNQPLTRLSRLLTADDPTVRRTRNQVAAALRQCAVQQANAASAVGFDFAMADSGRVLVRSLTESVELLQRARPLASPPTSGEIDTDLRTLRGMLADPVLLLLAPTRTTQPPRTAPPPRTTRPSRTAPPPRTTPVRTPPPVPYRPNWSVAVLLVGLVPAIGVGLWLQSFGVFLVAVILVGIVAAAVKIMRAD